MEVTLEYGTQGLPLNLTGLDVSFVEPTFVEGEYAGAFFPDSDHPPTRHPSGFDFRVILCQNDNS